MQQEMCLHNQVLQAQQHQAAAEAVIHTAPTVPGLSGQAISSSQINLSWTASTDNVGVTGYRIYRDGVLIDTSATNSLFRYRP